MARTLVCVLAVAMLCSILLQACMRTMLNWAPPWTEELSLLMFAWIVLLMMALCVRENIHVRVDILMGLLPEKVTESVNRAVFGLIALVAVYMFWSGFSYLMETRGSTSNAIRYPMELLYTAMPVASVLVGLFSLENALGDCDTETPSAETQR